jgi:hypothetical protein
MEVVWGKFAAMGLDMPAKILSCAIITKITRKRLTLMETLISNEDLLSHPKKIIAKLLDIANHNAAAKAPPPDAPAAVNSQQAPSNKQR